MHIQVVVFFTTARLIQTYPCYNTPHATICVSTYYNICVRVPKLLLACRSGNFEIAEILVCAGAGVCAAKERDDTPLLAAVAWRLSP